MGVEYTGSDTHRGAVYPAQDIMMVVFGYFPLNEIHKGFCP